MAVTGERAGSGRALVLGGLTAAALIVAASVVFGPALREAVRQEQHPRTLREPIAAGSYAGDTWEVVGRFDGTANCAELRYDAEVVDRACDVGPAQRTTRIPPAGPAIAYGVAAEDATQIAVLLDDGRTLQVPVHAGDLGFPVGFWALELPPGTRPVGAD